MKKYIAFLRGIGSGKPLFKGLKDKLKLTLLNATRVRIGKCPDQVPAGRGSVKGPGQG